jgi:hypothetical protein
MAKWPNHFISGKQFQKRPNLADLAFKRPNGNPAITRVKVPSRTFMKLTPGGVNVTIILGTIFTTTDPNIAKKILTT